MNKVYDFYITEKRQKDFRRSFKESLGFNLAEFYSSQNMPFDMRMADRFERICAMEQPFIMQQEKIVMIRTVKDIPDCFTPEELACAKEKNTVHELWYLSNVCPNYGKVIEKGLLHFRESADKCGTRTIDALIGLCDRYRKEAERCGRMDIVEIFGQIPRFGARNFREALQFFRILHYALWLEGEYHNTVGRFDVYMYPYFEKDMENGIYTGESALELIEDFFLSFNKDSDLYPGVQLGDNGQSTVLGGLKNDGGDAFSLLSELCLSASRNLGLIDPKLNLRVSTKTPLKTYELGTELTRAGLGFPQYSNDDIVIKGLERLGYDREDAVNYVTAACWEFIIPGTGMDIANLKALNFPEIADRSIRKAFAAESDFDTLMEIFKAEINIECDKICGSVKEINFIPSPFLDILMDKPKYRNFGIHGSGIANAADALSAVRKYVYTDKTLSPERLIEALDSNFANDAEIYNILRFGGFKMGNDIDEADAIAGNILDYFADALEDKRNIYGGRWRAGTGTAMFYIRHGEALGATTDGRKKGEPLGTNFSPALFTEISDPVSVIKSFTKTDLSRTINGGPLTLEFAANIFNNPESIKKVAMLIKYYISRGGHQLQLNAVNLEKMREAQVNPEKYRRLVVRVWGWSAYFVELDKCYQDHIMSRNEYKV